MFVRHWFCEYLCWSLCVCGVTNTQSSRSCRRAALGACCPSLVSLCVSSPIHLRSIRRAPTRLQAWVVVGRVQQQVKLPCPPGAVSQGGGRTARSMFHMSDGGSALKGTEETKGEREGTE